LQAKPPREASDWIAHCRQFRAQSLDRLDADPQTLQKKEKKRGRATRKIGRKA
jgi:hypothetical protein